MTDHDPFGDEEEEVEQAAAPTVQQAQNAAIATVHAAHQAVVDQTIDLYRTLHRTTRLGIRAKLERLYELEKQLGEKYGVGRNQYPPIDNG